MFITGCHKIKLVIDLILMIFITLVYNCKYNYSSISKNRFCYNLPSYFFRIKLIYFSLLGVLMIYDSQVYTALCIALLAAVLAINLGTVLYD